jgi:hypothetical protein
LESALATHAAFLPGDPDPGRVMDRLHAYCYFLEGVLPVAGEPHCAAVLREGMARVQQLLEETENVTLRSDVCAQLLRLRCYAAWEGAVEMDLTAGERDADRLRRFQVDATDPRVHGGVAFASKSGHCVRHINPVSTAFAIQALDLWERFRRGEAPPPLYALI